jgi:aldehyde:ferredoxin oxidoreductase
MSGFMGRIIRINLTTATVSYINTADYAKWGGGHGIGSALFFDIAIRENGLDLEKMNYDSSTDGGFNPGNVVTIMTSPLSGSGVPAATGRCEVQGIGTQQWPISWFTRTNFGGRFGPMIKLAGYDGIVLEGRSPTPVWVDVRDESITIRQCSDLNLWGQDTVETQKIIWDFVLGDKKDKWGHPTGLKNRTTQRPAVLTIGPAGEHLSRLACLIHDASNAAGQCGFGGVWGSKNLKAVSVIGTGSIPVNDPAEMIRLRVLMKQEYEWRYDNHDSDDTRSAPCRHNDPPTPIDMMGLSARSGTGRPQGCMGCHAGCRARYTNGKANEAACAATLVYGAADNIDIKIEAIDLMNRYGFNAYDLVQGLPYLKALYDKGVIGSSGAIRSNLNWSEYGSLSFIQNFYADVAYRQSTFGDTVAEGFRRAIARWGRESDLGGDALFPYWGMPEHTYDPRAEVEWGYGSILGDRDINEHCINSIHHYGGAYSLLPSSGRVSAEDTVAIYTNKMIPQANDYGSSSEKMQMLNFADSNIYSMHMVRLVSWHRHYTRYYKQSLLYCDLKWPDMVNNGRSDNVGCTGTMEPQFMKAITGQNVSFIDGMRLGRKIWNLDNAIWVLQGRHRDMVHFADYIYNENFTVPIVGYSMPAQSTLGRWSYANVGGRRIDRNSFENFKTAFYTYEGWNPATGWPTRATLEELGMSNVADTLARYGKL